MRIETEPDVVQTDDSQFVEIGPLHAAALSRLFTRNAGIDTTRVFDPFPLTVETARTIAERPDKDHYFAAELDGELLGITMLRGWEEGYETPSFGILVDREHRGRGLGRRMTELTIDHARAAGCARVRLSVYASNQRARRLYRRLGFVETGRSPTNVLGEHDERVVMILDVNEPGTAKDEV